MSTFNWFLPPTYELSQPQIFQSGIGSSVALTVKGASNQTADIFRVQDVNGTNVMRLDNSGNLTIAGTANVSLNEAITGNIALTGTLSVTGTSAFTGAVTMATLRVSGTTTLANVSIGNTLTVSDTATFNGSSVFNGSVSFSGTSVGFPNGTVSLPSITFTTDTDTGFYRIGANNLGVATNGVKQFDFSTTANTSALSLAITPLAVSGGAQTLVVTPAAHTAVTAEVIDNSFVAHTMTITGAITTERFTNFAQPTVSAASTLAITTGSTVNIDAAPTVTSSARVIGAVALQVGGALTMNNIAPSSYSAISVPAHTVTLSTTTQVTTTTSMASGLALGVITIAQSGGAVTVDTASTLYIAGSPINGASVTLTSPWSIFVDAGICRFDDHLQFGAGVAVVSAAYSIGRDAGGTNQLALNVPTGAGFILGVNGTTELTLSSTTLGLAQNTITGVGSDITGTAGTALTVSVPNTASGAGGGLTLKAGAAGGGSGNGGSVLLYPQAGSGAGQPGTIQFGDNSGVARLQLTPDTTTGTPSTNDMLFTASATYITYFGTAGATSTKDFAILRTASAVNWLQVTGGATGVMPVISAQGETNVSINLTPKGTTGRTNITAGNLNLATSANILINAANPKKTLFLSGAGGWGSTTTGATGPTKAEMATNKQNINTLVFADSGAKVYAEWSVTMPLSWDGSTVTAAFQWTANSTSTNSVVWGLQAVAYADNGTIDATWGTAQEVTDANTSTAYQLHESAASSAITIAGSPAGGQTVLFRAYRDSNNGSDTLGADALLIGITVTYSTSTYSD